MFGMFMDSMLLSEVDILITYRERCSQWQRLGFKLFGMVREVLGEKSLVFGGFDANFKWQE